jgi:DNA primase
MAPGSRKDLGFFSIPAPNINTAEEDQRPIILCESAIDAISCHALHPGHCCISTSGAHPNPSWLSRLIDLGRHVHCGFDADDTGERMARAMTAFHPEVQRLRPARHDWNDLLKSRA